MATRRPARLQLNRHGMFSFRWIVPTRLRDEQGKPREIRVSLRTRDARHARILAMSVNLALERMCALTSKIDPRDLLQQMTLQAGDLKIDIKDLNDLNLFNELLKAQPQLKDMLEKAAGSLSDPEALVRTLSQSVIKAAGQPAHGSIKPKRLHPSIVEYIATREGLSRNSDSSTVTSSWADALTKAWLRLRASWPTTSTKRPCSEPASLISLRSSSSTAAPEKVRGPMLRKPVHRHGPAESP